MSEHTSSVNEPLRSILDDIFEASAWCAKMSARAARLIVVTERVEVNECRPLTPRTLAIHPAMEAELIANFGAPVGVDIMTTVFGIPLRRLHKRDTWLWDEDREAAEVLGLPPRELIMRMPIWP